ncbi:MAG: ABC transporter permease [bacterium]|nr:ABC transporter permease [bacterium]MDE0239338.1 ABC transporter permease [bacterium]MDE0419227.1 ABC transporter permease [bacterium]
MFLYAVWYLAFLYIPVLFLPLFSFNDSIYVAFPLKGFSLEWYDDMVSTQQLLEALANSLKVGAAVAFISTILGLFAAKAMTRYVMPGKGAVTAFIMLPLVVPGIILGISLLVITNMVGMPLSLYTIGLAHTLISVPFATLVLMSRLEGFDKNLEEASLDLGEGPFRTFFRVTLPLAWPGILASLLLTFTISFDEFILAFFLAGNEATLPVYIWSQLRFPSRLPMVLALGATILIFSFFIVTVAEVLRRRGVGPQSGSAI